jgi:hypothetical protein
MIVSTIFKKIPLFKLVSRPLLRFEATIATYNRFLLNDLPEVHAEYRPFKEPEKTHFDVIIIGSGPSGLVAAKVASESKKSTLIIERGDSFINIDTQHSIKKSAYFMHERGLSPVISNRPTFISEGSVFGGGGAINSGLYQRLPYKVLLEWLKFFEITQDEWNENQEYIESKLFIHKKSQESKNSLVADLGKYLNWEVVQVDTWQQDNTQNTVFQIFNDQLIKANISYKFNTLVTLVRFSKKIFQIHTNSGLFTCDKLIISAGATQSAKILMNSLFIKRKMCDFQYHASWQIGASFSEKKDYLSNGIDSYQIWGPNYSCKLGGAVSGLDFDSIFKSRYQVKEDNSSDLINLLYASIPTTGRGGFLRIFGNYYPYHLYSRKFLNEVKEINKKLLVALEEMGANNIWLDNKLISITSVHLYGSLAKISGLYPGSKKLMINNLFVLDNSIIPSAPLANPQGPLMVLVHILAKRACSDDV